MKSKKNFLIILCVFLVFICVIIRNNNMKTEYSLSMTSDELTVLASVSNFELKNIVTLFYHKKDNYLGLSNNESIYPIQQIDYSENERNQYFINPTVEMLDSTEDKTTVLFYCALKLMKNPLYKVQVIQFDKGVIRKLWDSEFKLDKIFVEYDENYILRIPECDIRKELILDDKHKLSWFLTEEKEESLKKLNEEEDIILTEVEDLHIGDFDNDGKIEFITKRKIYWDEKFCYMGSFYSVWGIEQGKMKLLRGFVLDKNEISSQIISILMEQNYVYEGAILMHLNTFGYTDDEIKSKLSNLVSSKILQNNDNLYSLYVRDLD